MNIKTLLLVASLTGAMLIGGQVTAATEVMDQVVAIVDDDIIMASELRERVAAVTENLKARDITMPPEDELIRETLDRLILEKGYAAQQSSQILQEQWRIAVGEELFSQSRVGKIHRGILQVFVSNTIVLSELEYVKSKALRQLQSALPEFKLRNIRFKIG